MSGAIKIHPRTQFVRRASLDLQEALSAIVKRFDLTMVETVQILTETLQNETNSLLRAERHPKAPHRKADEL